MQDLAMDKVEQISIKSKSKDSQNETKNQNREVVEEICYETKGYTATGSTEDEKSRAKVKTKKFASDDLESMRADFARKQGVKEVFPANESAQPKNGGLLNKEKAAGDFEEIAPSPMDPIMETPAQQSTSLTGTVSNKSSLSGNKSKSKAKKFAVNDLDAMRAGFAKEQGVKEVKIVKDLPSAVAGKGKMEEKQNSEPSPVEEEEVFEEVMSPGEVFLSQQHQEDLIGKENKESVEEGDEGLVRRADDSEYEEVGRPPKESCEEKLEKKSHPDFLEVERDCKNEKGGVISDIVSDFKDFSSLKRKKSKGKENKDVTAKSGVTTSDDDHPSENKKEDSLEKGRKGFGEDYEVMIASSTPSIHIKSSPNDTIVGSASPPIHIKSERDDDIIGFDIKDEVEREAERLADEAQWKPAPAPYEAPDPPRPPARKSSLAQARLTSEHVSSTPSLNTVQREKKKSSFIKDWQRDLKEFFSLGRSKKNTRKQSEVSQASSSQLLVAQLPKKNLASKVDNGLKREGREENLPSETRFKLFFQVSILFNFFFQAS